VSVTRLLAIDQLGIQHFIAEPMAGWWFRYCRADHIALAQRLEVCTNLEVAACQKDRLY